MSSTGSGNDTRHSTFKWVWSYIKKFKFRAGIGLFLVIIVALICMINPYLSGIIVDRVIINKEYDLLAEMIIVITIVVVIKAVMRYTYQLIYETISQAVILRIRRDLYARVQTLDFTFFDRTQTGDIMSRMTGDMEAVRHFVAWVIYMVMENAIIFIFALAMLFFINAGLALIIVGVSLFIGFFTYKFATNVKPTFTAIRNQFSRLNSIVQENISGNRVVKAFNRQEWEIGKFNKENDEYKNRNIDSAKVWEKFLPVIEFFSSILILVLILAGGIMVINKNLTLGQLVTFSSFIWALNNPMRMSGWLVNDIQRFSASGEKIMDLLKTTTSIKNSETPVKKDTIDGRIEFRDVSFSYYDQRLLDNISFTVEKGQTIAIVGATGSGKSTLISLICRFYDCGSGEILVDDVNIKEMDLKVLRNYIAVAMQDIFLFSDTIEGNIAYGVPDASEDDVKRAAAVAAADEFILDFPQGYDTIIGERGVGLSGGQKQRIALARAVLKNPAILILDDTTSSVDMETEHRIHGALRSYYRGKTTFIIAHRISSVKDADTIIVLEEGKIVEQGKHDDLIRNRGYYYRVYINQYGDFDNIYLKDTESGRPVYGKK